MLYEVDLSSLITADGTYSLRVSSTSTDGADYSSKEGSHPPELVVTLGPQATAPGWWSRLAGWLRQAIGALFSAPAARAQSGGPAWAFAYDGDGKRVQSTRAGQTTTFVGDYYEVTGGVVTKYYYFGSQRVAMRTGSTLHYLLTDHLGSTSLVTDAAGNVISELRYTAWGEVRYSSGTSPTNYTYTGQYSYASDFGLMFYKARWLDPALGRFAQADSLIPPGPQGLDRYAYVNNAPVMYTDPSGHVCVDTSGDYATSGDCNGGSTRLSNRYQVKANIIIGGPPLQLSIGISSGQACSGTNQSILCLPAPTPQAAPTIPTFEPSYDCTPAHPCIGPYGDDHWWWDLDPSNPDYYLLSVSLGFPGLPGFTTTVTTDRYKNVYWGIGGNYGKSIESFSASLTGGFIGSPFDNKIPDANIESFLTGWAVNIGGGIVGGGGVTISPSVDQTLIPNIAWEGGGYLPPSIGISVVHSWLILPGWKIFGP